MRAAYPIHPEVFDRLYTDWSTLVPDDLDARLVVLGVDHAYSREPGSTVARVNVRRTVASIA
jgi:hypothetical protein